jgi:RNA polymerase sigma-70 factor (ECF subfamily)
MPAMEKTNFDLKKVIDGCLSNQTRAQTALVGHYFSNAKKICYHYVRNQCDAEEITDDGFVKVFIKLPSFDERKAFEPWLNTIMARTAIDFFRKSIKQTKLITLNDDMLLTREPECFGWISTDELMRIIEKLPPVYRRVFSLYHIFGYSHEEIAEQLGISSSTSRANLTKAKVKLQKWVNVILGNNVNIANVKGIAVN